MEARDRGSWGGHVSTAGGGFLAQDPRSPSYSGVHARRCHAEGPNTACTFCWGLELQPEPWHLLRTSPMLLAEASGVGLAPGLCFQRLLALCFKIFTSFTASAMQLLWLG